ncbi:MAG: hypothetical protein V3S41_01070 [Spirochaetia bacterium]
MGKGVSSLFLICGLVLLVGGIGLVVVGVVTRAEVIRGMTEEEVTTEIDGEQVLVVTADAAMSMANLIKSHTLGNFGSYTSMERDDPNRATYLSGLTLRNSLIIGRMGLQIGLLLMGLGALFLVTGLPLTLAGISNLRKS